MQQYFVAGQAQDVVTITDKDTVKHMFNVMRLTEDEEVVLVFDDHIKRLAKVIDSAEHCFEIIEELDSNVEMPVEVTIAAGFPKGDKLEFLAQKGTELGMANLWAFPADWSVVKWDGYEESAKEGETAVLARELSQVKAGEKILFIFGPEGGISPEEIAAFEEKGGLKIGLGPRIMRAETAPLYALSSVSYALELLKQE